MLGCEIRVKFDGPPPTDYTQYTLMALDTKTPYVHDFDGTQGNQTVHYMARWIGAHADKGPWSETVSATIPA